MKPTPTYQENYNVTFPTPWYAAFGDLTLDQNVDVDVANGVGNSFEGEISIVTEQHG